MAEGVPQAEVRGGRRFGCCRGALAHVGVVLEDRHKAVLDAGGRRGGRSSGDRLRTAAAVHLTVDGVVHERQRVQVHLGLIGVVVGKLHLDAHVRVQIFLRIKRVLVVAAAVAAGEHVPVHFDRTLGQRVVIVTRVAVTIVDR